MVEQLQNSQSQYPSKKQHNKREGTYICPRASQVYNLRTPVPILLQSRTLEAVERIRDALTTADDALVLVVAEAALVADADEGRGADVGVADGAFAVAFVAEAADGDAGLLAAHDEIAAFCPVSASMCFMEESLGVGDDLRVMARHVGRLWSSVRGEVSRVVLWPEA